jgi:hypothetical protein
MRSAGSAVGSIIVFLVFLVFLVKVAVILGAIVAAVALVVGGIWLIYHGSNTLGARRRKRQAVRYTADMAMQRAREGDADRLIRRAEAQNQMFLDGNDRGIYGDAYPDQQRYERLARRDWYELTREHGPILCGAQSLGGRVCERAPHTTGCHACSLEGTTIYWCEESTA